MAFCKIPKKKHAFSTCELVTLIAGVVIMFSSGTSAYLNSTINEGFLVDLAEVAFGAFIFAYAALKGVNKLTPDSTAE